MNKPERLLIPILLLLLSGFIIFIILRDAETVLQPSAGPVQSETPIFTISNTVKPVIPTHTTISITTRTPVPTITPQATPTPEKAMEERELTSLAIMGEGYLPLLSRSSDGELIASYTGSEVQILGTSDQQEITRIELGDFQILESGLVKMVFAPDNRSIALCTSIGYIVLDLETQSELARGGMYANNPVFFPDGQAIVVKITNSMSSGFYEYLFKQELYGHTYSGYFDYLPSVEDLYSRMSDPAISPDGKRVAAGYSNADSNRLYVWDAKSGDILYEQDNLPAFLTSVHFSPDGRLLIAAGWDGMLRFWDANTYQLRYEAGGFRDQLNGVQFAPDGKNLIVNLEGETDVLFNLANRTISATGEKEIDPLEQEMIDAGYLQHSFSQYDFSSTRLAISPDGEKLALFEKSIQNWSLLDHSLLNIYGGGQDLYISNLVYSRDGEMLAVRDNSDSIHVWNASGQLVNTISAYDQLTQFVLDYVKSGISMEGITDDYSVITSSLLFLQDGRLVLPTGPLLQVWDVNEGKPVDVFESGPEGHLLQRVTMSLDGKLVFGYFDDRSTIAVWDAVTFRLLKTLNLPVWDSYSYNLEIKGNLLAREIISQDGKLVQIWDLSTGELVMNFTIEESLDFMRFSLDGRFLCAVVQDMATVWDIHNGMSVFVYRGQAAIDDIGIESNNEILAVARLGQVELFDFGGIVQAHADEMQFTSTAMPIIKEPAPMQSNPTPVLDDRPVADLLPSTLPPVNAISARIGESLELITQQGKGSISQIEWGQAGDVVQITASQGVFLLDAYSLEVQDKQVTADFWSYSSYPTTDDYLRVAGKSGENYIQIRDYPSSEVLGNLPMDTQPVLSPNGLLVAFPHRAGGLVVWDVELGEVKSVYNSHGNVSLVPVFSPDSRYVATVQDDRSIRIWDIENGNIMNSVGGARDQITDVVFSTDGSLIAGAAGGSAWVWGTFPGGDTREIVFFEGRQDGYFSVFDDSVTAVGLSPDNRLMAIGTSLHDVWLYDINSETRYGPLTAHNSSPVKMAFNPSGDRLLSVDRDGHVVLWNVQDERAIAETHLFSGAIEGIVLGQDGGIRVWGENTIWTYDAAGQNLVDTAYVSDGSIMTVSPDSDLAASLHGLHVTLFNVQSGQVRHELDVEPEIVILGMIPPIYQLVAFYDAEFNRSGDILALMGSGGTWFFDTQSGEQLLHKRDSYVHGGVFSPHDQWFMTNTVEMSSRLTGYEVDILRVIDPTGEYNLADYETYVFSPDDRLLLLASRYGDQHELVFIVPFSEQLTSIVPLGNADILCIAVDPYGRLAAVGDAAGRVMMIDLAHEKVSLEFTAHIGAVNAITFSMDGRFLITGGSDGTMRVWQ